MSVRSAKEAIKEARLKAGLTQEQMAVGVCSPQALSRIESGASGVSPATFQALMEHAGAPCERYPVFANRRDFDCYYALKLARFHLDAWQLSPAWDELQKAEEHNWADNKLHYQEWLLLHCRLQFMSYQCDHKQNYQALLRALHITRPDIDLSNFRQLLLSQNEIQLLTAIAQEALYQEQSETCLAIHTQIDAYLSESKFANLEKERMQAEDAVVYTKYLLHTGDYSSALESADRYRHVTALHWNLSLLLELTFLTGMSWHYLGNRAKAAAHIKAAFYSAHAVESCYANACRSYLNQHSDFPMSDYMRKLPDIASIQYPAKEIIGTLSLADGVYNADATDVYTLGMLIHDLRTEQNLSLQTVCKGLCSKSKLSKIENGSLQPDIALTEALLQRLGMTERIFTFWGNERESKLNELKFKLIHTSALSKELSLKYLEEMEQLIEKADRLYYQDYLVAKALENESPANKASELAEALNRTLPDFDIYQINTYRLSWEELSILNCIATAYRKTDKSNLCSLYFYHVSEYLKRLHSDVMLQAQIYPHTIEAYCHTLYVQKQYNYILDLNEQYYAYLPLMRYNIGAYSSYLFYYCQALAECSHFEEAILHAVYACNINYLLGHGMNTIVLKKYLQEDFSLSLAD